MSKNKEFIPTIHVKIDRRDKDGSYTNREEVSFPLNYSGYVSKVLCITPDGWEIMAPLSVATAFRKGDTLSFAAGNIRVTGDILKIFENGYDRGYREGYEQGYDAALRNHEPNE